MSNQDELSIGDLPMMAYLERQADIFEQMRSKLIADYLGQYVSQQSDRSECCQAIRWVLGQGEPCPYRSRFDRLATLKADF